MCPGRPFLSPDTTISSVMNTKLNSYSRQSLLVWVLDYAVILMLSYEINWVGESRCEACDFRTETVENMNVPSLMNPCIFCDWPKSRKVKIKKQILFGNWVLCVVYPSLIAAHCIFYVSHQPQILQTHQKVLLIQCLWQYNKKMQEKSLVSNKQYINERCQIL